MATPAEIIAARVNGTYVAEPDTPKKSPVSDASAKSLADASAFPVLGGGASSLAGLSVSTSWGPLSNGLGASTPVLAAKSAENGPKTPKFRASTTQEAFSLAAEDQLNVTRPEFVKILTSIKTATSANIECTISQHTKKRTFLISGKPEQVKLAKRLVIRKLTKPIVISFAVPAKTRAKIIGAQGRTLKPIILQTETKIDIGAVDASSPAPSDTDDVFAQTVEVTVEGDADGCKAAKQLILAIVSEETKNMQVKVPLGDDMRLFARPAIQDVEAKYADLDFSVSADAVAISGDRAAALDAREDVRAALDDFYARLVRVHVPIPEAQQRLVPAASISAHNVVVREDGAGWEFVGQQADVAAAQAAATAAIADYKIEVLDMGKAHKGQIGHVRAVAAMFTKYGVFASIAEEHGVRINEPKLQVAHDPPALPVEIVVKTSDVDRAKQTRRAIVSAVNGVTPDQAREFADLDAFFADKIDAALAPVQGAKHVLLDGKLIIFDYAASDDLDDFAESSVFEECTQALAPVYALQKDFSRAVVEVSSANQKHIDGPNGSTLRSLLAQVPKDSVKVRLHYDGSASAADKVYLEGQATSVASVQDEIKQIVAEAAESGDYSTEVAVPTSVLLRIIGKGGAGLNGLREEYGVEIDVARERPETRDTAREGDTAVKISGLRRNASAARDAIAALAKKLADETLVRLHIENQYHRRIIGPHFSAINRLQDRYNVRIRFPSEDKKNGAASAFSDAPQNENEVTIRGPSKNVARAEHELKQLHQYEKEHGLKRTVQVPTSAIALVLGKDSRNIKDLAAATGIDYKFLGDRKTDDDAGVVEMELTGLRAGLTEAAQKIHAIVAEVENTVTKKITVNPKYIRDLVGPGGSVMRAMITKAGGDGLSRRQYSRLIATPDEGSNLGEVVFEGDRKIVEALVAQVEALVAQREALVERKLTVAKEKHRLLIGPGGSTRQALQEEFSVRLLIPSQESPSLEISLHGLPAQIEQASAKIAELTKDEWEHEILVPAELFSTVTARGALFKTLRTDLNVEVRHGNRLKEAQKLNKRLVPAPPAGIAEGAFNFQTREFAPERSDKTIPCRLVGSAESAAKAATILEAQLALARSATREGWAYVQDQRAMPRIVGLFGLNVEQMRKDTGAFISVPRPSEENPNVVYLVGTPESLAKAEERLRAAVKA